MGFLFTYRKRNLGRRVSLFALVTCCILFQYSNFLPPFQISLPPKFISFGLSAEPACPDISGTEDVLLIVKTGATEIRKKFPIPLLRCVPHYAIFSDLEEKIHGYHVHDALADVNEDIKELHPDFEIYKKMQKHGVDKLQPTDLVASSHRVNNGHPQNAAWNLDKWKFVPMAEKALQLWTAKWYVIIEPDTYLVWPNLLQWLAELDQTKPVYAGSQMQIGSQVFAHGGAGTILSRSALERLADSLANPTKRKELNDYTAGHWAGDCVLGKALQDAGVSLLWSWPLLTVSPASEHNFATVAYDKKMWCFPAITYHHMSLEEVSDLWLFEQSWFQQNSSRLLYHRDILVHYMMPRLGPKYAWDNLSDNEVKDDDAGTSFEKCRAACERQPDCAQFSHMPGRCMTSSLVKLGHGSKTMTEGITSGWMEERLQMFLEGLPLCENERWIL